MSARLESGSRLTERAGGRPPARPVLWLHIGLPKTASSFIQDTLQSNAELLAGQGYRYPEAGRLGAGHALLAFPFLPESRASQADVAPFLTEAEGAWSALNEEMEKQRAARHVIVSSEYFRDVEDVAPVQRACRRIAEVTRVVVYLRRQDRLLEAGYNQGVKAGLQKRRLILGPELPEALDWYRLVSRWAAHFGEENVVVRVFEEAAAGKGVLEDFCAVVGLDPQGLRVSTQRNPRLSNEVLEYRRLENLLGLSESRLAQRTTERLRAAGHRDRHVLSLAERRRIVETYRASNERVAREYLGRADGRLFDEDGLQAPDRVVSDTEAMGLALAVAWDELSREVARLREEIEVLRAEHRVDRGQANGWLKAWTRRFSRLLRDVPEAGDAGNAQSRERD